MRPCKKCGEVNRRSDGTCIPCVIKTKCHKCGSTRRSLSNGKCLDCELIRDRNRQKTDERKASQRDSSRRWRLKNPEKRKEALKKNYSKYHHVYRKNAYERDLLNPEAKRERSMKYALKKKLPSGFVLAGLAIYKLKNQLKKEIKNGK